MKLEEEILISAYLDGELAGEEQQRAEKLLAASPTARQLADEMRAVRAQLQSLPRFGLSVDFAEQTVRRAEKELAAARMADAAASSSAPRSRQGESSIQPASPSIWQTWRGYAWAAVALAAALMIVLNNRQTADKPAEVAQNKPTAANERVPELTAEGSPPPQSTANPATPEPNQLVDGTVKLTPPLQKPMVDELPRAERAAPSISDTGGGPSRLGSGNDRLTADSPAGVTSHGGEPGAASSQGDISANDAVGIDGDEYLFVTLSITPEAAQRHEFKQLLTKHGIVVDDESEKHAGKESQARRALGQPIDPNLEQWVPDAEPVGKPDALYFVEASPQQLRAAIDDLASAEDSFSAVAVAKRLPVRKSKSAKKDEDKVSPPAPAPQAADPAEEPPTATEILAKPSEHESSADSKKSAPTDAVDRSAESSGRATRMPLPPEKVQAGSAAANNAALTGAAREARTNLPSPRASVLAGEEPKDQPVSSRARGTSLRRALFVLRTIEKAPVPAAAAQPAAPQ